MGIEREGRYMYSVIPPRPHPLPPPSSLLSKRAWDKNVFPVEAFSRGTTHCFDQISGNLLKTEKYGSVKSTCNKLLSIFFLFWVKSPLTLSPLHLVSNLFTGLSQRGTQSRITFIFSSVTKCGHFAPKYLKRLSKYEGCE